MTDVFVPGRLHIASCGKFAIYGVPFFQKDGNVGTTQAWHLTLLEPATPEHPDVQNDYWVSGLKFQNMVQGRLLEGSPAVSTFVLDEAFIDPPVAEKRAALRAIAAWEGARGAKVHVSGIR